MRLRVLILALAVLGSLAGCAENGFTSTSSPTSSTSREGMRAPTDAVSRHRTTRRSPPRRSASGLPVSRASAHVVQQQPPPGSCHARGHGRYALPDPHCTPGAVNPSVTQATIGRTICVSGWTKTVRPSESITEREKRGSMAAYGDTGSLRDYEYDHLVSLELGGAVNDARNLWPEPGGSPNPKDSVEDRLHRMVCDGQMRLARAQHIIATEWVTWARQNGIRNSSPPARPSPVRVTTTAPGSPAPAAGPDKPISEINCSDFPTHAAAQSWFEAHGGSPSNDVAGLDANHDGQACTSLP
jgi:hypothetical protein